MLQLCSNFRPQDLLPYQFGFRSGIGISINQVDLNVTKRIVRVWPLICSQKVNATSGGDARSRITKPIAKQGSKKSVIEGSIAESLPNGMFRVNLDNGDNILGYISGKIRKNFIKILPGDRVKVEMSVYDASRGRIVFRMNSKN